MLSNCTCNNTLTMEYYFGTIVYALLWRIQWYRIFSNPKTANPKLWSKYRYFIIFVHNKYMAFTNNFRTVKKYRTIESPVCHSVTFLIGRLISSLISLPAPDGPQMATTWPLGRLREKPSKIFCKKHKNRNSQCKQIWMYMHRCVRC